MLDLSKTYYIAGPITALTPEAVEFNKNQFRLVTRIYREMGCSIKSPLEIKANKGLDWVGCMRNDIGMLLECNGIIMLKGWLWSRGASLEHEIARKLDYQIQYLDDHFKD